MHLHSSKQEGATTDNLCNTQIDLTHTALNKWRDAGVMLCNRPDKFMEENRAMAASSGKRRGWFCPDEEGEEEGRGGPNNVYTCK
jgi:hypothetical protein